MFFFIAGLLTESINSPAVGFTLNRAHNTKNNPATWCFLCTFDRLVLCGQEHFFTAGVDFHTCHPSLSHKPSCSLSLTPQRQDNSENTTGLLCTYLQKEREERCNKPENEKETEYKYAETEIWQTERRKHRESKVYRYRVTDRQKKWKRSCSMVVQSTRGLSLNTFFFIV